MIARLLTLRRSRHRHGTSADIMFLTLRSFVSAAMLSARMPAVRTMASARMLMSTASTVQPASFDALDVSGILDKFELIRKEPIHERGLTASIYRHKATGAEVLSINAPDENKVFSCNFRTLPKDDTGVPHILEHSVLCGSRQFPVKAPVELLEP